MVVIDDETGSQLKRNLRKMLRRVRPDKLRVRHNLGVTSRTIALSRLPLIAPDASLEIIENELVVWGFAEQIVLEDVDFDQYGKEMNRIISQRPHGRSRSLDGGSGTEGKRVDPKVAQEYVLALKSLIGQHDWAEGLPNPRRAVFTYGADEDLETLSSNAQTNEYDTIVLFFEPGREDDGPTNIAIYEKRSGRLTCWPRCSVWGSWQQAGYLIASDDAKAGFIIKDGSIFMVWNVPDQDLTERLQEGRNTLKELYHSAFLV